MKRMYECRVLSSQYCAVVEQYEHVSIAVLRIRLLLLDVYYTTHLRLELSDYTGSQRRIHFC